MVVFNCWLVVAFFGACVSRSKGDDNNELLRRLDATEAIVKSLSHRVDILEAREKIHLERIVDLESKDKQQQETIEELKHQLQEHSHMEETTSDVGSTNENEKVNDEPKSRHQKHLIERTIYAEEEIPVPTRQTNIQSPVAFLALLTTHLTHLGTKQIIIFDKVMTNIGNGYDAAMGIFTAPVEGIYVFSAALTGYNTNLAEYSFYHNNVKVNTMAVNNDVYESTGSTITLHLQKGDIVTVRNDDPDHGIIGYLHSSFTGFLLNSYESA